MNNINLENELFKKMSHYRNYQSAVMYRNSAPMFGAQVETLVKRRYFVESSQFESSDRTLGEREYALKCIGQDHTYKMLSFKSHDESIKFHKNMNFTENGGLIVEKRSLAYNVMHQSVLDKHHCSKKYYNDGYTSLHGSPLFGWLVLFVEGDITIIHCATDAIYQAETESRVKFYENN